LGVFQVIFREPAGCPPGAEAVIEQKADHVGLGEQLGNGRQFPCADFYLRFIDALFVIGLPELVHPA
jgi:hypothetical protein